MKKLPLDLHYNSESLATVLSFKTVSNLPGVRVMYDNEVEDVIHVILPNKFVLSFKPCQDGLYYLDSTFHNYCQIIILTYYLQFKQIKNIIPNPKSKEQTMHAFYKNNLHGQEHKH